MAFYQNSARSNYNKASTGGAASPKPGRKPYYNKPEPLGKGPRFTPPGGWNQEFQAIFDFIENGQGNGAFEAVAGAGKTSVLIESIIRCSEINPSHKILFVAFNVSIKEEGSKRLAGYSADVLTSHALGYRSVRKAWGGPRNNTQFDIQDAFGPYMRSLAENALGPEKEKADDREALMDLISKAKTTLTGDIDGLIELMEQFAIDTAYPKKDFAEHALKIINFTKRQPGTTILKSKEGKVFSKPAITFDDMIWLPVVNDWPVDKYDDVFVDEAQDLSLARRELIRKALKDDARLFIVGDKFQCVSSETLVRISDKKQKKVSSLKSGDTILSWRNNSIVSQKIKHIIKSDWSWGYKITLSDGKTLTMSPNHKIYASQFSLKDDEYIVYLMYRADMGFRIGITNKYVDDKSMLGQRARSEHADKLWILKVCKNKEDALYYELSYSLEYGIPTYVFNGEERGLNQKRINDIFETFGMNGAKLLVDNNLHMDCPHWFSTSMSVGTKQRIIIHLIAHGSKNNIVSMEWSEDSFPIKSKLEANGFSITPSKNLNRFRIRKHFPSYKVAIDFAKKLQNSLVNCSINEKLHTPTGCYGLLTASALHVGMNVPTYTENTMSCSKIVSIEKVDGEFYDIDVDDASNFFGNDILSHNSIFSFAGADINALPNMIKEFNCKTLTLSCSWRCDELIIKEAQQFNPIIQARPNATPGIVDKCQYYELLDKLVPGDVLLSRTNAPLVRVFFQLAKQKRKVKFIGRDYGKMLSYRINTWKRRHDALFDKGQVSAKFTGRDLINSNDDWYNAHIKKDPDSDYKVSNDRLKDEWETMMALTYDLDNSLDTQASVKEILDRCALFSPDESKEDKDGKNCITISSTHRFKGLEREHAYVMIDTYAPGTTQEETNLIYVAVSRAKNHLSYVMGKPGMKNPEEEDDDV
jgi:hypothetical protein